MDKRVGFGQRLLAALIDGVIVGVAGLVVGGAIGGMLGGGTGGVPSVSGGVGSASWSAGDTTAGGAALVGALGAVFGAMAALGGVVFLYSLIEAFTGASPGKMVLKLKVGLEDGRPAPVSTYVARWAVKYAGTLLGVVALIPGLHLIGTVAPMAGALILLGCFLALGDKRQALHDFAARTAVFRTSDLKT
jgi:uncharacterized RDD family membrane protein YckC